MAVAMKMKPAFKPQTQAHETLTQSQGTETAYMRRLSVKVALSTVRFTIGALCFHRKLLPDQAFDHKKSLKVASEHDGRTEIELPVTLVKTGVCQQADDLIYLLLGKEVVQQKEPNGSNPTRRKKTVGGLDEAIEKQYLKKLSLVILLDPNDRDNIVEAYTFDFSYCPETGIPGVTMSQSSAGSMRTSSSLAFPRTKSEITKTLIGFVDSLNQTLIGLEALPRQRYIDIRVQYTDNTPANYSPDQFQSVTEGGLFIATHDMNEVPVSFSSKHVPTAHHNISLLVSSAARYLPGEPEASESAGSKEVALHKQSKIIQLAAAKNRAVLWDPETLTIRSSAKGFSPTFIAAITKLIVGRHGERTMDWEHLVEESGTVAPLHRRLPGSSHETHESISLVHHSYPAETKCFQSSGGLNESLLSPPVAAPEPETPPQKTIRAAPKKTAPKKTAPKKTAPEKAPKSKKAAVSPKAPKARKAKSTPKKQTGLKALAVFPQSDKQQRTLAKTGKQAPPSTGIAPLEPIARAPKVPKAPVKGSEKTQNAPPPLISSPLASGNQGSPVSPFNPPPRRAAWPSPSNPSMSLPNAATVDSDSLKQASEFKRPETTFDYNISPQASHTISARFGRNLAPLDFGMAE